MNEDTNIIILLSHYSANVFRITLPTTFPEHSGNVIIWFLECSANVTHNVLRTLGKLSKKTFSERYL